MNSLVFAAFLLKFFVSPWFAMSRSWEEVNADMRELRQEESALTADYKAKLAALRAQIDAKQKEMNKCWKQMQRSQGAPAIEDAVVVLPDPPQGPERKRGRTASTNYPDGVCKACWRRKLGLPGGPPHGLDSTCMKGTRTAPLPEA